MNKIFFSVLARDDLQDIWDFIAADSPQGAKKFILYPLDVKMPYSKHTGVIPAQAGIHTKVV